MTAVDTSRVTDAVVAALRTGMSPILVGDGTAPTPDSTADTLSLRAGYVVVYPVPAGAPYRSVGWAGQPESMTVCRVQIVGIGIQRNQAERIAERAIKLLVDRSPTAPRAYVTALAVTGATIVERVRAGMVPLSPEGGVMSVGGYVDLLAHVTA